MGPGCPDLPTGAQITDTLSVTAWRPGVPDQGLCSLQTLWRGSSQPPPATGHLVPSCGSPVSVPVVTQLHPVSLTPRGPSCGPGAPKPVCLL